MIAVAEAVLSVQSSKAETDPYDHPRTRVDLEYLDIKSHQGRETQYRGACGGTISANTEQWCCFGHLKPNGKPYGGYFDSPAGGPPMPDLSWRVQHPLPETSRFAFCTPEEDWVPDEAERTRQMEQTAFGCLLAGWSEDDTRAWLIGWFGEDTAIGYGRRAFYGKVIKNERIQKVLAAQTLTVVLSRRGRDLANMLLSQIIATDRETFDLGTDAIRDTLEWGGATGWDCYVKAWKELQALGLVVHEVMPDRRPGKHWKITRWHVNLDAFLALCTTTTQDISYLSREDVKPRCCEWDECRLPLPAKYPNRKYCSDAHRQRARDGRSVQAVVVPVAAKVTARAAALAANERTYVGKRCPRCGEKAKWTNWGSCATCETWEQAHDRVYPPVEYVSTWDDKIWDTRT